MASVGEILTNKGTHVFTVGEEATVLDGALLMNEHRIGALVVTHSQQVVGIFTERDILQRVVSEKREPSQTIVREVMTSEVVCCTIDTSIDEARTVMMNRRIRHLPVVDGNRRLIGLISIGDLNAFMTAGQEQKIYLLQEYLHGRS